MKQTVQKEEVYEEIRQAIRYVLHERELKEVSFDISDLFRKNLINQIIYNFDNSIDQNEYVETVLRLIYSNQDNENGDKSLVNSKQEVEQLIQTLIKRNKKVSVQKVVSKVFPVPSEIEIVADTVIRSHEKLIAEKKMTASTDTIPKNLEPALHQRKMTDTNLKETLRFPNRIIWTIASGKGGTGKSIMAANLGVGLAVLGYKVILIDGDLGVPNLHNHLHIKRPKVTLDDFLSKRVSDLSETLIPTPLENLNLICGASKIAEVASIHYAKKLQLIKHITRLPADIVFVDIGAGVGNNMVDLFNLSPRGIIISNPDANAIQDGYFLLKSVFYRRIKSFIRTNKDFKKVFNAYLSEEGEGRLDIQKLQNYLNINAPDQRKVFENHLKEFQPRLIMNKMYWKDQNKEGFKLLDLAKTYINVELNYLGDIIFEERVIRSARGLGPFIYQYPKDKVTENIYSIIKVLEDNDLECKSEHTFRSFRRKLKKLKDTWV
jgi:flagellar biosynthesis protein FlhG